MSIQPGAPSPIRHPKRRALSWGSRRNFEAAEGLRDGTGVALERHGGCLPALNVAILAARCTSSGADFRSQAVSSGRGVRSGARPSDTAATLHRQTPAHTGAP
ncbi:hypothetical protein MVI01_66340 [Myxococcus virescens]|uniref:Uncharacterized protein n=1 Tax=Myxococcus virescens TaxID=83456 RepID=A0A511HMQ4_9BACT|nr:hypothetical protein MVI01_66340 [Myxococcus virescens]